MEQYDEQYYENGVQAHKSNYYDYSWERLGSYFLDTAKHIQKHFQPKSLLDVGTAKGFLVSAACKLGIDAYGIDPSKYAVSNAIDRDRVQIGLAQDIPWVDNSFDVVTAFDVLEHLPEIYIPETCNELLRVSKDWVIVRVPTEYNVDDLDTYHETIKPKNWWEGQFKDAGGEVLACDPYLDPNIWWFNTSICLVIIRKS